MKASILLIILLLLTLNNDVSAQLRLKVKKGVAFIGTAVFSPESFSYEMKSTDILELESGSILIVRQDVTVIELQSGRKYGYDELKSLIKKSNDKRSGGFINVAFGEKIDKGRINSTRAGVQGASNRTSDKFDYYYPKDSSIVYGKDVVLSVGDLTTEMKSKVIVKNLTNSKIYFEGLPNDNCIKLSNLESGKYEWSYTIANKFNTGVIEYLNTFTVLNNTESKRIKTKINTFKKNLSGFSPTLQTILLEEFHEVNNYCASPN